MYTHTSRVEGTRPLKIFKPKNASTPPHLKGTTVDDINPALP